MSQQLQITGGAKVRDLNDVIIGTSGVLSSLAFNVANGVPKLDSNAKILVSQLPNSVMEYQGTWNAATNTPTLTNGGAFNQGDVYLCNVAGTVNFGAGPISFIVGDSAIYSGSIWQRSGGATGSVTSVGLSTNGDSITIGSSPITTSGTITANFNGTNLQYVNGAGNLTTFPTLISSIGLSMPSAFSVSNSPLTANGTIAVTGAGYPSQYIRGDGTLADFPTSGGGGSSVSYYLNGGTSQGTIGGITYYEMSKTADTGTGVDFPKTGDGLIVSFLTDAGDPAQLNIPAGNWNYEIYASMSANGGTPQMYAELYKYDGTTFTLIATSSNEILYDGVNLNLYTFAMTVPATTLTLTDRLAVKLYATNSGGKTTTVHTQDSHLCQVITTFSTGITALNGLTAQVQYFGTGTSGTDFNISSTTATHTFNIPDASATARGLITTGTQTIAGAKDFSSVITVYESSGIRFTNNPITTTYGAIIGNSTFFQFSALNGASNILFSSKNGTAAILINSAGKVDFGSTIGNGTYTYTLPSATGTVALTSDLSSYVPYTGATADVNLGIYSITGAIGTFTNGVLNGNGTNPANLYLKKGSFPFFTNSANYGIIAAVSSSFILISDVDGTNYKYASFNLASLTNNTNRAYTLPDATGTLALTSDLGSYVPTTRTISTTAPLQGGGDLSANRTLSITQATTSTNGYLSSTDWTTFNNKLSTATAASTYVPYTGATGAVNLGAYDLTINGLTVGKGGGNIAVNTVLGYQALNSGTSTQNDQNTAIGYKALFSNTIGQYNTSVGYQSLYSNVNGYSNSALGWYSLYFNTGANNTANGYRSSYANTTGAGNSAFGTNALDQNSTGQNNTSLGYYSGYGTGTNYNTTGSNNIFIGYQSVGESSTASNRTWIGNTSTTSTWLGGNLLLGTRTDSGYRLDVSGTGRFTGQITNSLAGHSTIGLYLSSYQPSGINWYDTDDVEQYSMGIIANSGNGYWGLWSSTSGTAIDRSATTPIFKVGRTGAATFSSSVTAGGVITGQVNGNTFGTASATGRAVIIQAGSSNQAIMFKNAAGGDGTLFINGTSTTLDYNFNTYSVGDALVIKNNGNVGIGTSSPASYSAPANQLVVGTNSGNNGITIAAGTTGLSSIYLADGTTGNEAYRGYIEYGHTSDYMAFGTAASERMRITSGGVVRINSTSDINSRGVLLQVSGPETAQLYGYGNGYGIGLFMCPNSAATGTHTAVAFRSPANGDVGSINTTSTTTTYNITSDYRLKQDFKTYNGLNLISEIKTYDFEWKEDNSRMYGVIAHELAEVIPYAVTGKKDAEEMQGVDYSKLVPILIKSIQEQNQLITSLQEQINELKNK